MKLVAALLISTVAGFATLIGGLLSYLKISKENINKFIGKTFRVLCDDSFHG